MPLDARVRRFLDLLAATNPPSALSLSVEDRRAALGHLMGFGGPPAPVERVTDWSIAGRHGPLRARVYTPRGSGVGALPGIVYFHGGGLVAGSVDTHDAVARSMAQATGCRVVSVEYRLAPEHRFPAAVEDAIDASIQVMGRGAEIGIDPARVGVAGDSAGATLAAVVCQSLAHSGDPQPAMQLLLCPILDYAGTSESRRELASGYLVDDATLAHDLRHYLPAAAAIEDPRVSPLRSTALTGIAPTHIHAAEFDPLRDEAAAYAQNLRAAGVAVSYTCHPGMIHLFYGLGGVIPYAQTAWAQIGAQVGATFGLARAAGGDG